VFILEEVKVICFDALLQVLITKELEGNIIHGKTNGFDRWALQGSRLPRRPSAWVTISGSERKNRERAPTVEAQILTRVMIAEELRYVKWNSGGVASTYLCKFEERFSFPGTV
jgi:hypothetical protein